MIDSIKWALDHFGKLTDQRGKTVGWREPPLPPDMAPREKPKHNRPSPKARAGDGRASGGR